MTWTYYDTTGRPIITNGEANPMTTPNNNDGATATQSLVVLELAREAIRVEIAMRNELEPSEAARDAYRGKTAGLTRALELLG